ncbi:MAG: transposase [Candidatus Hydrogenedentes bacterium]|nr:transposase [Candidatus Hydrogenedentota bacterium]
MNPQSLSNPSAAWAHFRFAIVGSLLSAPPSRGDLQAAIAALANRTWTHPITQRDVHFSAKTIERWFYRARAERDDPVGVLRRAVRKDCGQVSLSSELVESLTRQYHDYPSWTYQLHYDNLQAQVQREKALGPLPSYSSVRRYMVARGLTRKPRPAPKSRPGELLAARRREQREIRSYEAAYVGGLWHLDFHHGSRKILTARGEWLRPLALGILDDHSRLCCHLQWYLSETTEDLVHGLSQALQKRGLPRALMTDNGAAMMAEEFREGLLRLGIVHETTLPYSAYQNGKQESFWGNLEGRLMEMLHHLPELTLDFLNQATQAWVELDYNHATHRELGCAPVTRWTQAKDVLRASLSSDGLRQAFRMQVQRRVRRSDGTISLGGQRFEIPSRYRHFRDVVVRYPRWDLGRVDLIDPRQETVLCRLWPWDRQANADGQRALLTPTETCVAGELTASSGELPPLLKQLLAEYSATGLPPAYLPQNAPAQQTEEGGAA